MVRRRCPHKKLKINCFECGGSNVCVHQKNKFYCTICKNSTVFCEHGREKRRCKNQKQKHLCKSCDGTQICVECSGCPHGKLQKDCATCVLNIIITSIIVQYVKTQ